MPSESGEKRARSPTNIPPHHPPPKFADQLPCPRCKSPNTKFCYYNNYNLSQPRHFCKACRRYWTAGGTLRNVPVGGGTRKNSKRSRSTSSITTSSTSTSANPEPALLVMNQTPSDKLNLPESGSENLISLLNTPQEPGFMGMDRIVGYGSNVGYGLCEIGVGFGGRTFPGMGCDLGDGNNELLDVNGESFLWPGFAISKGFK